jgi:hypothetical protein
MAELMLTNTEQTDDPADDQASGGLPGLGDDRFQLVVHVSAETSFPPVTLTTTISTTPSQSKAGPGFHHLEHWADGGPTCLPNLISLCDAHNWLVHDGGWSITGHSPTTFTSQPELAAVTGVEQEHHHAASDAPHLAQAGNRFRRGDHHHHDTPSHRVGWPPHTAYG